MDTISNVLANYNSILDYMAKCINDKFIRLQKICEKLDNTKNYIVRVWDKERTMLVHCNVVYSHNKKEKVLFDFKYEDTCCSNDLPCKNYKDSIIGMTTADVERYFSKFQLVEIQDENNEITICKI